MLRHAQLKYLGGVVEYTIKENVRSHDSLIVSFSKAENFGLTKDKIKK